MEGDCGIETERRPTGRWVSFLPCTRVLLRSPRSRKQDPPSTQEDPRARFFEDYGNEAEEYDREFMKKHDEDLNTALIFVSSARRSGVRVLTQSQAGLFSAVTSAFIIEVHSHLQPDPNDETAALLRVLIHKVDNTTFGNDPPTIPQWTGPPQTIVQVQAILLASLAASLLSAFLAMLGKQWLNQYVSTDMRGTAIERSQNRQRKLDGVVTWYFDHVMDALPLMLQIALLLLGCALSRYLWGIDITVASVVLSVTLLGITFYAFIIVAGTVSESCPYQTPGARFFRHIFLTILPSAFRPARSAIHRLFIFVSPKLHYLAQNSFCCRLLVELWSSLRQPWSPMWIGIPFVFLISLPGSLIMDFCFLGPGMLLITFGWMVRRLVTVVVRAGYRWFITTSPKMHGFDRKIIALDVQCVSWMLQTSLDKSDHLSALEHLEPLMSTPTDFDPALVAYCFDAFIGCINVGNCEVEAVVQGLEQLANVSAMCFFHTVSYLSILDPTSRVLKDVIHRYNKVFPANIDFRGHRFSHIMNAVHKVFIPSIDRRYFVWDGYKPSRDEHTVLAQALIKLAQSGYERSQQTKVPCLILRFALYSLSLDPPPPIPVAADCLSIIAVDLDCDISNVGAAKLNERCVHTSKDHCHSDLESAHGWSRFRT